MTLLKCRGGDGLYFTRDRFSYFSARADARTHTYTHNNTQFWQFIVVMDIIIIQSRSPLKVEKTRRYSIIILSWWWRALQIERNVIIWVDVNPSKRGLCAGFYFVRDASTVNTASACPSDRMKRYYIILYYYYCRFILFFTEFFFRSRLTTHHGVRMSTIMYIYSHYYPYFTANS